MTGKSIDQIAVGDGAQMTCAVNAELVTGLVTFAASTTFGEPIAPGMLTAALVAAVIGSEVPGPGGVYLSQSLKFLRPVRLGDTIIRLTPERLRRP